MWTRSFNSILESMISGPKIYPVCRFVSALACTVDRSVQNQTRVILLVSAGRKQLTNAIFLIGSFLLMKLNFTPEEIWGKFQCLDLQPYRAGNDHFVDSSPNLIDCWTALQHGIFLKWIALPTSAGIWGSIDVDEYDHYASLYNGDLVQVIPNKLVAFPSPVDLPTGHSFRDNKGHRCFSPEYFAEIFSDMGVRDVIALQGPDYDTTAFRSAGIACHRVHVPGALPDRAAATEFLRIVDAAPRLVAVHCDTGLGRTGALAALLLIRDHGFSARAAVAWLRILRPGSVLDSQARHLAGPDTDRRSPHPPAPAPPLPDIGAGQGTLARCSPLRRLQSDSSRPPAASSSLAPSSERPRPSRSPVRNPSNAVSRRRPASSGRPPGSSKSPARQTLPATLPPAPVLPPVESAYLVVSAPSIPPYCRPDAGVAAAGPRPRTCAAATRRLSLPATLVAHTPAELAAQAQRYAGSEELGLDQEFQARFRMAALALESAAAAAPRTECV